MKYIISAFPAFLLQVTFAIAGDAGCTKVQSCKAEVKAAVVQQTKAASSGARWKLSPQGCQIANREQEGNAARCRSYDRRSGGKTLEECAKCYRQAVFDTARWEQCSKKGWAPAVPRSQYSSIAELGKALNRF